MDVSDLHDLLPRSRIIKLKVLCEGVPFMDLGVFVRAYLSTLPGGLHAACAAEARGGTVALTQRLATLAGGRVVVALEGGYNVVAVARGLHAVTAALLGAVEGAPAGAARPPSEVAVRCVRETVDVLREFWPALR